MAGGRCRFRYGQRHRMKLKRQSELTLPTRTAIVQTPFTAELGTEATRDYLPCESPPPVGRRSSATRPGRERRSRHRDGQLAARALPSPPVVAGPPSAPP